MTDTIRDLLISLASHMAYMQGQLEAHHEHDDPEDYYWYRESVLLRQKVTDALLADEPAVPEGREPAAVITEPSDEEGPSVEEVEGLCEEHCFNVEGYESIECLQGLINEAIARWGNLKGSLTSSPPADGEVAELVSKLQKLCADLDYDDRGDDAGSCYRAAELLQRQVTDALADEPAVPEGREPAAVISEPSDAELSDAYWKAWHGHNGRTLSASHYAGLRAVLALYGHQPAPPAAGEPSDEDCWQWYTYCPEEGLEMYSDREQAQSAAQSIMGSYEVAAHSDGWHEDMESVSWGMLVPVEQAQVVECKAAEPDDEFDEWVKYELRPALYGHQPAPPAAGEVAELVAWLCAIAADLRDTGFRAERLIRAAELLQRQALVPVSVSERLPEPNTKVLAHYFNALGNGRTICAIWVPAKSRSDESVGDDFTEYDEEDDKFYWPEGWYETIENWDELGYVQVCEGEVDYWQPLPKWPARALPLPEVNND